MLAPETLWAPQALPFSSTATGISPSVSVSSGSSSSSCMSLFAHASPAGPPPTITIPASRRSSSGSVGGPTTSSGSNGGGNFAGATAMVPGSAALLGLHGLGQLGQDLVQVADDPEVAELEDRRVRVLVDRDDVLRGLHADLVLDRAGDAGREVELGRDGLAGLPDLARVREPAGVHHRAGRGHRSAERLRELVAQLEVLGLAEPATSRHEEVGVLDVHVRAALLPAGDHRRPGGPGRELDVHIDDFGRAAVALDRVEGVQAADDDAGLADVGDVGD